MIYLYITRGITHGAPLLNKSLGKSRLLFPQFRMVNFTILAGGYTTLISAFSFMPGQKTGSNGTLSLISQSFAGNSPSWIQRSPHNSSIL